MNSIEFRFDHPWLLLTLIPALLLILIPYFRLPARRRKHIQRWVPAILHSVLALALALVLAGASIVRSTDNQAVILLLDYSDSTLPVRSSINAQAESLQKLLRKNSTVRTVAFGGDWVNNTKNPLQTTDATDLSSALEYAASLLPEDKVGRIIVLSDGRQTDGDAAATAQYLQSQGVRIDAMWFDSTIQSPEVQLSGLIAPESTFPGRELTFTAELESNTKCDVDVTLYNQDTVVDSQHLVVTDGTNVLTLEAPAAQPGVHNYRVEIKPVKDTYKENNQALACVEVVQAPKLLVLYGTDSNADALSGALKDYAEITALSSFNAPRKITQLCDYDGVILMNVHAEDLPKNYGDLLNTYVSTYGRSLVALGGQDTFMYGGMRDTAFEEMMPTSFYLSRTSDDDAVALMLVMDCSLSMSQESAYMSVAKQGAIKCVEGMTENDYVGIISFNQNATVEAPLDINTQEHKDSLNRIISGLATSKGTYYTDALALAHRELLESDAAIRHILFVSDGGPADTTYKDLIPDIAADGITISTIALGHESTVLSSIAESCGGTYYFVKESTDLPDIMLSLTRQISVNSLMTGSFTPMADSGSQFAKELPPVLPAVDGYLGTTLKRGAESHITVGEENHPLFASWTWGKGTVALFASDLDTYWSNRWLQNKALVQQLLTYVLPQNRYDSAMVLETVPGGQSIQLTLRTPDTDSYTLTMTGNKTTSQLACIGPGVYRGTMPTDSIGGYAVTVTQYNQKGEELDSMSRVLTVPVRLEYDIFGQDGSALLKTVCLHAGGSLAANAQSLAEVTAEAISTVSDFRIPIAILFVLILLTDIAIRKLRWKDIKNIWLVIKHRKK